MVNSDKRLNTCWWTLLFFSSWFYLWNFSFILLCMQHVVLYAQYTNSWGIEIETAALLFPSVQRECIRSENLLPTQASKQNEHFLDYVSQSGTTNSWKLLLSTTLSDITFCILHSWKKWVSVHYNRTELY
jgi:hypothetical protein